MTNRTLWWAVLAAATTVAAVCVAVYGVTTVTASTTIGQYATVQKYQKQSIPNRLATLISWDTEHDDSLGAWTSSDPTHLKVTDTGLYLVTVQSAWMDCTCGYRSIHLQVDGGGVLSGMAIPAKWETGEELAWQGRLQAGKPLSVWVYQDSGQTLTWGGNVRKNNVSAGNEITIERLG
jgi:hypothetical protein